MKQKEEEYTTWELIRSTVILVLVVVYVGVVDLIAIIYAQVMAVLKGQDGAIFYKKFLEKHMEALEKYL